LISRRPIVIIVILQYKHNTPRFSRRGFALAVGVKVRDKESIDRALRRFKRSVNRSRVLRIFRQNMAFTKPSEERRVAKEKAQRNSRKHSRRY
jgi:small subunit ribosomal protein S21